MNGRGRREERKDELQKYYRHVVLTGGEDVAQRRTRLTSVENISSRACLAASWSCGVWTPEFSASWRASWRDGVAPLLECW